MSRREQTRHKHLHLVPAAGHGTSGSWVENARTEAAPIPELVPDDQRRVRVESVEVVPDERLAIDTGASMLVPHVISATVSYGRVRSVTVSDGRREHTWEGLDMIAVADGKPAMPDWVGEVLASKNVDVDGEVNLLHAETGNVLDEELLADRYPVQPVDVPRGEAYGFYEYRAYRKTRVGSLRLRHGMVTGYWTNPDTGKDEPVLFETLPDARGEFTAAERDAFMLRTRKQIARLQVRNRVHAEA